MNENNVVKYEQVIPDVLKAMGDVHMLLINKGFDQTIHHLIQLRASQINKCGFCVNMHLKEARNDGETTERLDQVIVWDLVDCFSKREKAALAWTEALTALKPGADMATLRAELRDYFSDEEIGLLTASVAMINLWNRMGISKH